MPIRPTRRFQAQRQRRAKRFEYALPIAPDPYESVQAKEVLCGSGLSERVSTRATSFPCRRLRHGEAITGYLGGGAGGRHQDKMRTMERDAFFPALAAKKFKGLLFAPPPTMPIDSTRMSAIVPTAALA